MLTSIHIEGFKNFKDTKIESLRKVNLILGGQNVGKTSLLEAVWLGAGNLDGISKLPSTFRLTEGKDIDRFFENTFFGKYGSICLNVNNQDYIKTLFNVKYESSEEHLYYNSKEGWDCLFYQYGSITRSKIILPIPISVHASSQFTMASFLDAAVIKRKIKELIVLLNKIEPRLEDIRSLAPDGEMRVYVELNDHPVYLPLPQLGHGFSRILDFYCSLLVTDSKLALIDEIENGIHYSSLPTMFKGIQQIAADNDIQSLITTHSWECLRAACEVFSDKPELFQVIRLERDGDNTKAVCIEGERMLRMMERDMEVR